jgi:PKD repeat protein
LNSQQSSTGAISYSLDPAIQFGDQIKYILKTDNGLWVKKDTIIKTFGAITLQALEDATTVTNWTGNWSTTTSTFVSPSKSFFDGSTNNYSNNTNKTYTYIPTIDLTQATAAMVSFYAKWGIEADYDFVQFQVSTDGGTTWIGQCGNYTVPGTSGSGSVQPNGQPVYEGTQSSWVLEEINLSDYLGQQIKVRFQLRSDGGTTADGFYFDDFKVFYSVPTNNPPTASFTSPNSVCQGTTVSFIDFSTNSPSTWAWNFGDGNTSNQQNPTHTYSVPGNYSVSLTVTNSAGTNTTAQNIVVNSNPIVSITSNDSDNLVCDNGGLIQLTSSPSNAILSGTGVGNSTFNPSLANVGANTITANYTDANGCQGTAQLTILVEQCASLEEELFESIQIFPNPNKGVFQISGLQLGQKYFIQDLNGKIIFAGDVKAEIEIIILPNISNGFYYLNVNSKDNFIHKRFTIFE